MKEKEQEYKKTLCCDFDGVIYSYKSGWIGDETSLPDRPIKNARWGIKELREKFSLKVVVYSTRCRTEKGRKAIEKYLKEHDIVVDGVVQYKPIAFCYLDDRGLNFDGNWARVVPDIVGFLSYMDTERGSGIMNKKGDYNKKWID